MAKFSIEFDSENKSLVVRRDGQILEDVVDVTAFKAYMDEDMEEVTGPKFHLRIVSRKESEDEVYENLIIEASDMQKTVFNSEIDEAMACHFGVL